MAFKSAFFSASAGRASRTSADTCPFSSTIEPSEALRSMIAISCTSARPHSTLTNGEGEGYRSDKPSGRYISTRPRAASA